MPKYIENTQTTSIFASLRWRAVGRNVVALPLSVAILCSLVGADTPTAHNEARDFTASLDQAIQLNRIGDYRKALAILEPLALREKADATARAFVVKEIADIKVQLGDYGSAERITRQALSDLTADHLAESAVFALAEGGLGDALRLEGKDEEARAHLEHALLLARKTVGPHSSGFGMLLMKLVQLHLESGNAPTAETLCKRGVAIFKDLGDAGRLQLGIAYTNLAVIQFQRGKARRALELVNLGTAAWKEVLPPDHPFTIFSLKTQIDAYTKLKQFDKGEAIAAKALELYDAYYDGDHFERLFLLTSIAGLYIAERQYERAEPPLRESAAIARRCFPKGHPVLNRVLNSHAGVLVRLHRQDEALSVRREANFILGTAKAAEK